MRYRKEIDGLRAIAVLPVILFHAGIRGFEGGFVGVDIFFVISGYLITSIIVDERRSGRFSFASFYERRARRILPALFAVVLLSYLLALVLMLPGEMEEYSQSVFAVAGFSSNIFFWRTTGYFDAAAELKPLLHTWSLAIEEQYYFLFPLFLALAWRIGERRLFAILLCCAIASVAVAQWASGSKYFMAAFFLLPTRVWELLIGSLAAFSSPRSSVSPAETKWAKEILGWLGVSLIALSVFCFDSSTPFPGLYALVPTIGTILILLFCSESTFVGRILSFKAISGVGLISYSAYLWHQPVFAFVRQVSGEQLASWTLLMMVPFVLLIAYLTWRYIESPLRDRTRFEPKEVLLFSVGGTVVLLLAGAIGVLTDGFIFRYSVEDRYLASIRPREEGRYVQARFAALDRRPFDGVSQSRKVLVIGDSLAQDVVNAFSESRLASEMQFTMRHIGYVCGNLFVEQRRILPAVGSAHRAECERTEPGLYTDGLLRRQMAEADEVWFAAWWLPWQVELVPDSVANVRREFGKTVRVFGRKDFGIVNLRRLLSIEGDSRYRFQGSVSNETIEINSALAVGLASDVFVDVQKMLCGVAVKSCSQFTPGGALVSYDGVHLTQNGARQLGGQLLLDHRFSVPSRREIP